MNTLYIYFLTFPNVSKDHLRPINLYNFTVFERIYNKKYYRQYSQTFQFHAGPNFDNDNCQTVIRFCVQNCKGFLNIKKKGINSAQLGL